MSENFNDKDKLTNEPKPERKVWDVEKGEYVDDTREDDDKEDSKFDKKFDKKINN